MKFKIVGKMKVGSERRRFTKELEATSENHAKELVYSLLGSQNGIKRSNIEIAELKKVE